MNYYKLINGNSFVGVVTQLDFRKYQHKHKILLSCDENSAQYVQYQDALYRSFWMMPVTTDDISYHTIDIIRIDEEEYNILIDAIASGEEIAEPDIQEPVQDVQDSANEAENITLEYVKNAKLAEIKMTCEDLITSGFDVQLSDGNAHHFSLTTQDQLNLTTLSAMVANGEELIPYHADGELCKFYSAEDISTIIAAATSFKTYHVTYYNALRGYIMSMDDIVAVSAVTYGVMIPAEYQSDVLKFLLSQMDE